MRILFLFLDGVGLGSDDPEHNPFAAADLPTLTRFTRGKRWLNDLCRIETERGIFIPTDACLDVPGKPQSATGQATILTGINVAQLLGRHYGPRPNPQIADIVSRESVVRKITRRGFTAAFLNAFPAEWFEGVERGRLALSSNQLALEAAGVEFYGAEALHGRQALSADFTGRGWREHFADQNIPLMSPFEAGNLMARLATQVDFAFFDHWPTDYVGHRGTLEEAVRSLEVIDGALAGILAEWHNSDGLVVLTSDHGNIECIGGRGHTLNPVPTLVIGSARRSFADSLTDLTGFTPAILRAFDGVG